MDLAHFRAKVEETAREKARCGEPVLPAPNREMVARRMFEEHERTVARNAARLERLKALVKSAEYDEAFAGLDALDTLRLCEWRLFGEEKWQAAGSLARARAGLTIARPLPARLPTPSTPPAAAPEPPPAP